MSVNRKTTIVTLQSKHDGRRSPNSRTTGSWNAMRGEMLRSITAERVVVTNSGMPNSSRTEPNPTYEAVRVTSDANVPLSKEICKMVRPKVLSITGNTLAKRES